MSLTNIYLLIIIWLLVIGNYLLGCIDSKIEKWEKHDRW